MIDAAEHRLAANVKDLPFTLIYLFDADATARLAGSTGIGPSDPIAPTVIDPAAADLTWPAGEVLARRASLTVDDLRRRFEDPRRRMGQTAAVGRVGARYRDKAKRRPRAFSSRGPIPTARSTSLISASSGWLRARSHPARERDRLRGGAPALGGARGARSRQDDVFFQREPRIPHAADAHARSARVRARQTGRPSSLADNRSLIQVAHRNGVRLLKLVNTLLDFSRIEAGRMQAIFEPVDLAAFTAELASSFRSTIERAGLRLLVDCPPLPEQVHVNRDMWEKLFST